MAKRPKKRELFYIDADGKQDDAKLHDEVLEGDDRDFMEMINEAYRTVDKKGTP